MKNLILYLIICTSFSLATSNNNIFIIKDKDGKVLKGKRITHNKNYDKLLAEQAALLKELARNKLLAEQNSILNDLDKLESKRSNLAKSAIDYNKENILTNAKKHLGGKYVWGGTHPKGFDCSGYMQYIYKKEGVSIPRTANAQSKVGKEVSRFSLKKGDLLFFLTDKSRNMPVTHVGMYIGDGNFIHAASKKKGIIITSLDDSRYSLLFVKATRVIK
ncbi:MAG: NLP/P60 family protein [uncultured Sulfurovum sp.]|uniref:NLP/P60 family protein n=1 Tax=uncultured Sulfurovum sp. TaxID=269237 RepID=A0A6S6S0D0_9BACT|nr:MAG: NLP/P60 family protein [uncultured Sulfurovum sp.]